MNFGHNERAKKQRKKRKTPLNDAFYWHNTFNNFRTFYKHFKTNSLSNFVEMINDEFNHERKKRRAN